MEWMQGMLSRYPELAVYLAIGIGYWVGAISIRGFKLSGVTGSLIAGIVIGLLFEVPVSAAAKHNRLPAWFLAQPIWAASNPVRRCKSR